MADDEQFSLCWNNFNTNLSAGFHESLCRGDLVDVTLAAEGQLVKAHRLVLSVCSPYFRKMFTQMPANQHAFVFLKDVSHSALKDLIQFMYCGEVNVKQEALPAFISTAEALQIKGLTDSDPPASQTPPEPSTPTQQTQQVASPRMSQQRQRTSTSRSYKIETVEDTVEDKTPSTQIVIQTTSAAPPIATIVHHQPTPQLQHHHQSPQIQTVSSVAPSTVATTSAATLVQSSSKRSAQRSSVGSTGPHTKRTKSTIDPLESAETATTTANTQIQPQQITVQSAVVTTDNSKIQQARQQTSAETEYIDLPTIELPTKSEPEYTEDTGEVVTGDQDTSYVEDDAYGDMRYDESYFTENEDGAPAVSAANASGTVAASTSKALIKQQTSQSFSDSSYVDPADGANSEAQVPTRVSSKFADKDVEKLEPVKETSLSSLEKDIAVDGSRSKNEDKIPLHDGSTVFIAKKDLTKAYIPNACIYTSRLTDLVFGRERLKHVAQLNAKDRILLLDKEMLQSIIIHVRQVFAMRGEKLEDSTVLRYIQHKLSTMNCGNAS